MSLMFDEPIIRPCSCPVNLMRGHILCCRHCQSDLWDELFNTEYITALVMRDVSALYDWGFTSERAIKDAFWLAYRHYEPVVVRWLW